MSPSSAPRPVPANVQDAAIHLDAVVAVAVRHGTASTAWQHAAERFLERLDAATATGEEIVLHIGPGHVVEVGVRDGSGDLHTHAWHDIWRDGLRAIRWSPRTDRAAATAMLRAMCASADAHCARALQGVDVADHHRWQGADREEDTVTAMLRARSERATPGDPSQPVIRAIDPTLPAGGPLRDAWSRWTVPPRAEAARALIDAVVAGVEAPRRPGMVAHDAPARLAWRHTASTLRAHAATRLVAVLEARTNAGTDTPETIAREWLALTDEALGRAGSAPETAWETLGRAIDAVERLAGAHPGMVQAFHAGFRDPTRARTLATQLAHAPTARRGEAARWLVSTPPEVLDEVSRALAEAHDSARAEALEQACAETGAAFAAGRLYRAHMRAPAPVARWALARLNDHHAGEASTTDALRIALTHPDPQVQHLALVGLGGDRSEPTREALDRALLAHDREIVAHTLEELLQVNDDGARSAVLARIQGSDFAALPPALRISFLDAAARLEGPAIADWMGDVLAQRGWFLHRDLRDRQSEVRTVLTSLATPWARAVLARGEKP